MRRGVMLGIAIALGAILTASVSAAVDKSKPPRALYNALLTTSISSSKLPSAFKYDNAKVGTSDPSKQARSHHVVGEVEVDLSSDAVIQYIVFPIRADAVADWKDANLKKKAKSTIAAPPPFPWPALIANFSITGNNVFGKKVTNGVTTLGFTSKNVIVDVITISTDNASSGDVPGTIALGKFALAHLNALRR